MKRIHLIGMLLCLCFCAEAQMHRPTFRLPDVPTFLASEESRIAFIAEHYWDHFDFRDTMYIHFPEIGEQAFADYIDFLQYAGSESQYASLTDFITKASADKTLFLYILELCHKYLYDPNSPMRNDEFYIPILEVAQSSSHLDKAEQARMKRRLKIAIQNRIGSKANDFTFIMADGSAHQFLSQGESLKQSKNQRYILLYFFNPDCQNCKEVTAFLKESKVVNDLENNHLMQVIAIFPDEDLTPWMRELKHFPKEWITGYDRGETIRKKQRYDLKAIPSLYLMDENFTVLLKDVDVFALEAYLR